MQIFFVLRNPRGEVTGIRLNLDFLSVKQILCVLCEDVDEVVHGFTVAPVRIENTQRLPPAQAIRQCSDGIG